MLLLVREGGFVMVFVIGFGLLTLGWSISFAVRPDRRKVDFIKWMKGATLFAILSGFAADFGATLHHVAYMEAGPDRIPTLLLGLGESMSPGIIGFSVLSLACLASAIGARRLARTE
jgi:hypothetical protein